MRAEPFVGYSWVLRTIIWVVVPAFSAWQYVRLRRAFHVFQMESYKRPWFRAWCRGGKGRSLFLTSFEDAKKPLVMTGRAWRTVVVGTVFTALGILVPSGLVHISVGTPYDLITCALMFALMFFGVPYVLLAADVALGPVQRAINGYYLRAAGRKLGEVAPIVVGVTGSFGKTSTKFAIDSVLASQRNVLATPESFNTPLGVSRTINEAMTTEHEVFVVEMGARRPGDIAEICRLVRPRVGVLTAIGPAHLETFGSLDAIRRTKYEIVQSLPEGGTAVMNVDDPEVRALADVTASGQGGAVVPPKGVRVVRYGVDPSGAPDVTATDVATVERGTTMRIRHVPTGEEISVRTRLLGRHAVGHVLAGAAVAIALEMPLSALGAAIEGIEPTPHRLQIIEGAGGVTVIDDAYNSNPLGAAAALDVLAAMPGRKKIVITPGMVEMGDAQHEANVAFGKQAAAAADVVIAVAALNREALLEGAQSQGDAEVIAVASLAEATDRLKGLVAAGDVVLFENDLPDQYER